MGDVLENVLIPLLSEMISNRCVNTGDPESGNEVKSADTLERFFNGYGIPVSRFELIKNRTNLLVRIPGRNPKAPSLMYMGHTDVVPAREDDWSRDPFGGEVVDGELWGRGAVDMLNMTASMAVGIAEAYKKNGPYDGDLCFLAVADEEASGNYGAKWLTDEHWKEVRADFMIAELGGFHVDTGRGSLPTITLGEKGIAWLRLTVKGTPGHGSMPYRGNNSVVKLSRLVSKLDVSLGKPVMHPMFRRMASGLSANPRERFLLSFPRTLDAGLSLVWKRSRGLAKFLHTAAYTSVSPNVIRGGDKVNVIPDRAYCDLDIRLLPGQTDDDIIGVISREAARMGIDAEIKKLEFFPSNVSEEDTPLMRAVHAERASVSGAGNPVPMMIGGVTDGRFWRRKGTTVYGYVPFDAGMTMSRYASMIHGIDERISLCSLQRHIDFFRVLPEYFYSV